MTTNITPANQQEEREIIGVPDAYSVISALWERAADGLSEKELKWFVNSGDTADSMLSYLEKSIEHIGCTVLIPSDSRCFDDETYGALLIHIAQSLNGIRALASVSLNANDRLINREFYQAMKEEK